MDKRNFYSYAISVVLIKQSNYNFNMDEEHVATNDVNERLLVACENRDLKEVKILMQNGADANFQRVDDVNSLLVLSYS